MGATVRQGPVGNGQREGSLITHQQQLNEAKAKLEQMKGEIEKIAGSLVSPDELVRFTLNACVKNPKLFECFRTPEGTASVFLSIITSRMIEIPCDGIHGYLVPFFQKGFGNKPEAMICQFMPGYKGFAQLAYQNPNVASVDCCAVYENDQFDFEYGTEEYLRHRPTNGERGQLAWAYAIFKTKSGASKFRVLNREDVLKRKAVSKSKENGPWKDWEPEMWAKTAFLWLAKMVPLGDKVSRAVAIDDRIQTQGNLTVQDIRQIEKEPQLAMGFESPAESFETFTDDRRQTEPATKSTKKRQDNQQEQEQSELTATPSFEDQIQDAMSVKALDKINEEFTAAAGRKEIDGEQLDSLLVRYQERKKELK